MAAPAALVLLLVGNSLSAGNDLPAMLEAMGKASGIPIRCAIVAKPNFSLEDHWKDRDGHARAAIARGGWTHVIMQQGPSALPESRVLLHEYARRLATEIRQASATPAMMAVWPSMARRADFDRVAESYRGAAAAIGGPLFAVGDAWRAAWKREPALALYGADGFHPSPLGSCLAAMVIFQELTGRLPAAARVPGLSAKDIDLCRAAVAEIAAGARGTGAPDLKVRPARPPTRSARRASGKNVASGIAVGRAFRPGIVLRAVR